MREGKIKIAGWRFMGWILDFLCSGIVAAAMYLWPSGLRGRIQAQKAQFESREGRTPISYFC